MSSKIVKRMLERLWYILTLLFYTMCGRRISGWSSFWRRSRSLARSLRDLYVNWLSRRTIVAGMTAPTEHNHPIISIRLWLCMYVSTFLQQRLRGGRKRQTCVCVCTCVHECVFVYLCCVITFQSHRAGLGLALRGSGARFLSSWPRRDCTRASFWSSSAEPRRNKQSPPRWLALWTLPSKWKNFRQGQREFATISFASFGNRKGVWSH